MLKVGDKLKNGALVIAVDSDYVLAWFNDREYVSWVVDKEGNAHWGSYYGSDITAAAEDYGRRLDKAGL